MAVPLTASDNNTGATLPCPYRSSFSIISTGVDDTPVTFNHGVDFSNMSGSAFANLFPGSVNIAITGINVNATPLVVTGLTTVACTVERPTGVASVAGGVSIITIERAQVNGW